VLAPAPATTIGTPTQAQALVETIRALTSDGAVRVGLVAHNASLLPEGRTLDIIDSVPGFELVRIFAPEHGLAGTADAGQPVNDDVEPITGVPVRSLYGDRREPEPADLADLDVVVYDLQDVGVRAYTYIATMGIMMAAAHEKGIPFVVLDRPNPQGPIIDGPVLVAGLESFISPYPIPTTYGLSSGELALLLAGEGMVHSGPVTVVGPAGDVSEEWISPSPNLPSLESTWLYPAVVAFEATSLSEGRGTDEPFTMVGGPGVVVAEVLASMDSRRLLGLELTATAFTPRSIPNMAPNPRYEGQNLPGIKLATSQPLPEPLRITVELIDAFMDASPDRTALITRPDVFDRLVGDPAIRQALLDDVSPAEIAAMWADDVERFRALAARYRIAE
jgi:uncharacterized protein YbbC (DUF1343 family)